MRPSFTAVWSVGLALGLTLNGGDSALAQTETATVKDPVPVAIPTNDGWQLAATYYESPGGKESPVIVLLHGEKGNRLIWNRFAEAVQKEGFAVVSVDLRKHGESKGPAGVGSDNVQNVDYEAMVVFDLPAVKKFLYEKHQAEELNMRKTGLVASDVTVPVAVNFAIQDWLKKPYRDAPTLAASTPRGQDVRALVFISPADRVGRVLTARELLQLKSPLFNVGFLLAKADGDKLDRRTTDKMYEKLQKGVQNPDDRIYFKEYKTRFRGTDLLGRGRTVPVEAHMLQFFKLKLLNLADPWVDRKPRI